MINAQEQAGFKRVEDALDYAVRGVDIAKLPCVPVDNHDVAGFLPDKPALYFLVRWARPTQVMYIGCAASLKNRWREAYQGTMDYPVDWETRPDYAAIDGVMCRRVKVHDHLDEALKEQWSLVWWEVPPYLHTALEVVLIRLYKPELNVKVT